MKWPAAPQIRIDSAANETLIYALAQSGRLL